MWYQLPALLAGDRRSRAASIAPVRIASTVTLTDGVPRIDVRTEALNVAEDHRLRAHFPSGVQTDVSKADQHFGVIARPVALPAWDRATWAEEPMGTYPQKAFVSVDDGAGAGPAARGLTIGNNGLPEYEALAGRDGVTIAVTLLRCVGWLSRSDISSRRGGAGPQIRTPGAQLHGRHVFDYCIIPHEGDWEAAAAPAGAGAHALAYQRLRPMRARWNRHGLGRIEAEGALLSIDSPAFNVSAIKRAEDGDGVIVRLYNITNDNAEASVELTAYPGAVSMVNLNEELIADVPRIDGEVDISARPNEIISLRFRASS
jgi:alpha-mannosidase